jgi:phosphoesterase RecJ-like protein
LVNKKDIATLREQLARHSRIVLLSHVNPDGDSIGSSLALYHYLREMGKEVMVIIPNDLPAFLQWLPGAGEILVGKHAPGEAAARITAAEILFFLDFNETGRLKKLEPHVQANDSAFRVLIDHHPSPQITVDLSFSETSVSSTAELLYDVLKVLEEESVQRQPVAINLYAGIMTDTGCFRYNASYPHTWEAVAELMRAGIHIDDIYARIYDNYSEHRMRLMGYALDKKMVILPEKHTGYIWLTRDELDHYSYVSGDTEGFVNLPLSVEGIRFSALFLELGDRIKISFRSKGSFAVNTFSSAYFNGGGHRNAAGGECTLTMQETLERFESLLEDFTDEI